MSRVFVSQNKNPPLLSIALPTGLGAPSSSSQPRRPRPAGIDVGPCPMRACHGRALNPVLTVQSSPENASAPTAERGVRSVRVRPLDHFPCDRACGPRMPDRPLPSQHGEPGCRIRHRPGKRPLRLPTGWSQRPLHSRPYPPFPQRVCRQEPSCGPRCDFRSPR
jgi:hypothetical protein